MAREFSAPRRFWEVEFEAAGGWHAAHDTYTSPEAAVAAIRDQLMPILGPSICNFRVIGSTVQREVVKYERF